MNSTGVIFLILAIVLMLALMYFCCWWYCTHGRLCKSRNGKNPFKGPPSLPDIKNAYISLPINNNNNKNDNSPQFSSPISPLSEVDSGKVKYPNPSAPLKLTSRRQPSLTEAKYTLKNPFPIPETTLDVKHVNSAYISPTSMISTATKLPTYQPLYERKFSTTTTAFGDLSESSSSRIPYTNTPVKLKISDRKSSLLLDRTEPWLSSDKRSVSPRPASPSDASSWVSNTSKSSKYTNIRAPTTTNTNVSSISRRIIQYDSGNNGGDDAEQMMTIRVKASEADKVSSILIDAVRSGDLSTAEAVTQDKTIDVTKMVEQIKGGESTVDGSSSLVLSSSEASNKTEEFLTKQITSIIPSITTTTSLDGRESSIARDIKDVMMSIEESSPGYTVQKTTVVNSSKQEVVLKSKEDSPSS